MLRVGSQRSLKDRIVCASSVSFNPSHFSCGRPKQYKNWDEERLHRACEAVQKEHMSIRKAADAYRVPKSTLQDRVSGKVAFGATSGPSKYLTEEEEDELVNFLVGSASVGFACTRKQVLSIVQDVVNKKGLKVTVSYGWWDAFKRRHSNITIRSPEHLSYCRAVASSSDIIDRYYDLLEQTFLDTDLFGSPAQIFRQSGKFQANALSGKTGLNVKSYSPMPAASLFLL